jgi:hypothetical protein
MRNLLFVALLLTSGAFGVDVLVWPNTNQLIVCHFYQPARF